MKSKLKVLITAIVLILTICTPICFATNNNDFESKDEDTYKDLYVDEKKVFDIKNIVKGNGFISAETLNVDPQKNGGIIEGDLFVMATNVNIKSDVTYKKKKKDELGNSAITINKYSSISGNVYALTNEFVLEPGSQIDGDLYVCANKVSLGQNAKISGNVFVITNNLYVNSEISKDLYATAKGFNMDYYCFINRDLHLSSENANINGYVFRNTIIDATTLTVNDNFINQKNFTVTDADKVVFSGEIKGNADINAKYINLKNKDAEKDLTCKIAGNLKYSSDKEIDIPENTVIGDLSYSKYMNTISNKTVWKTLWNYLLDLITVFVTTYIVYLIISKFMKNYLNKISSFTAIDLLIYLGIGLALLILIPIIVFLLILSNIGIILGFTLLLIYIALILIARPVFVIAITELSKNKLKYKLNTPLYILIISAILAMIYRVPFLGFIVSILINFIGFGMIIKNLKFKK